MVEAVIDAVASDEDNLEEEGFVSLGSLAARDAREASRGLHTGACF